MRPDRRALIKRYGKKHSPYKYKRACILILFIFIVLTGFAKISAVSSSTREDDFSSQSDIVESQYKKQLDSSPGSTEKELLYNILNEELGKPYIYGSEGPDSFDCSGLAKYAYASLGINLPRVASDQAEYGSPISKDDLEFGDLVFFSSDGITIDHVGIYIGGGFFEHAPHTGSNVKISSMDSAYYSTNFKKAMRIIE